MRDQIIASRIHRERKEFVDSIQGQICALASTYHNGDKCEFFNDSKTGSYNVCFFVRFTRPDGEADGDRWVVRVPLEPSLAMPAWEKVETEVATIRYVASQTTIPVPTIHGYSTAREKGPYGVGSFMIQEYIDGTRLDELGLDLTGNALPPKVRNKLNTHLADIHVQLSRLKFPAIGRLVPNPDGSVYVGRAPISSAMNQQQLEGAGVLDLLARHGGAGFTSASDYFSLLLENAVNWFEKSRVNSPDETTARRNLYFLHQFTGYIRERWADDALDQGPFVLAHGDLHLYNLMVNEDLDLLAVIDWEWAQTVPLQLFVPPTWLTGKPPWVLTYRSWYQPYTERVNELCSAVEEAEVRLDGEVFLSRQWTAMAPDEGILVGWALQCPYLIEDVMRQCVDRIVHKTVDREARINRFIKEDPRRGSLIAKKVADWLAYEAEREQLGIQED